MIDQYTPTIIKNIATRIDLLRTEQNLSVRDLAKKSGISKSQLSDIILGNKIPNVYTLHLICTALGISLSDFFNFDYATIKLRGKETLLIKIYRELSPISQDTLIKVAKCMK
jgi:transcriptional regulator with XRE-family HTH domain